jgi:hypothetical protein
MPMGTAKMLMGKSGIAHGRNHCRCD